MKKLKVTKIRSDIGRPARQKRTLEALGLRKINSSNVLEASPQVLGMIEKVRHMVITEEVDTPVEKKAKKVAPKAKTETKKEPLGKTKQAPKKKEAAAQKTEKNVTEKKKATVKEKSVETAETKKESEPKEETKTKAEKPASKTVKKDTEKSQEKEDNK